jgi:anthranilate synthase component 1
MRANRSRYSYVVELANGLAVVGASPELLVSVTPQTNQTLRCETHPIAGTRRRGATPVDDEKLRRELLADEKERAEHVMLVDLGRNDLNRVCEGVRSCVCVLFVPDLCERSTFLD